MLVELPFDIFHFSIMKLKPFFLSRKSIANLSRRLHSYSSPTIYRRNAISISPIFIIPSLSDVIGSSPLTLSKFPKSISFSTSSLQQTEHSDSEREESDADDGPMTEFLSRFTWIMRGKLSETYSDCDEQTINGMLLIIVDKVVSVLEKGRLGEMLGEAESTPSLDLSQDLWKTVWEVSNSVLDDMKKARKKEKMKVFLQSEDVKEMCRFASEAGVRGDMLREFRFKWAREKMEESEFYQSLERVREEDRTQQKGEEAENAAGEEVVVDSSNEIVEEKPKAVSLPQRRGKIKYKIYGLDLSDPKWAEVADRIHEAEKYIEPEEPKPITGKCKLVTSRIFALTDEDDPSPLLAEWVELLQPSRIDWLALLDGLSECNVGLYFKIAELVLNEETFQANIRDFSKLIDAHAKNNCIDDAERILKKMSEKGFQPDIITSTIMVHMYSKTNNLDRAKQAFEDLRSQGFQPDLRAYNSMIMTYVNAGEPKLGESLMREMEARDIKPTKEIYMALLRSFSEHGYVDGAQRIATTMQFAGFQPSLESCTLLIEAYGKVGDPDQARSNFDYMIKLGHKPDDKCTASMIAVYGKKNLLDKALDLLLQLEKHGFEPGVATYTVLVDWFGKLQLVDEVEELLGKIIERGDTPPFKVHVSLCDMYARAGDEKKALRSLGILEGKKELLGADDFERIINGLISGGLIADARRLHEMMEAQGFSASEPLKVSLMASQAFRHQRPAVR